MASPSPREEGRRSTGDQLGRTRAAPGSVPRGLVKGELKETSLIWSRLRRTLPVCGPLLETRGPLSSYWLLDGSW